MSGIRGLRHEEESAPIHIPLPVRTPRLLIRPQRPGEGAATADAIHETWDDLHRWMAWAERLEDHTPETQEARIRDRVLTFGCGDELNLIGLELATSQPVIWCGFHSIDWPSRHCETGYWVRKSAQNQGFATESTHALLRYAFGALGMQRVGISHAGGNEASRRVIAKLGFTPEGIQPAASYLPGGRLASKYTYARYDTAGLDPMEVRWDPV